jgi:hypothetical protein
MDNVYHISMIIAAALIYFVLVDIANSLRKLNRRKP